MANTGLFHHVGTFLLFAAAILLLITTISSPVINDIAIMKVSLTNGTAAHPSSITFGTFGYCIRNVAGSTLGKDYCTGKHIGYNPAELIATIDDTSFSTASTDTSKALTRVMILHPVACGLAFIAFLFALGSGICGALFASFTAALAWVVTVVVMATDLAMFAIVRNHINSRRDTSGSHAKYSVGMWTLIAAMICLFLATFIVLFTCCSARRHKKQDARVVKHESSYGTAATTKRHFWQRRSRY